MIPYSGRRTYSQCFECCRWFAEWLIGLSESCISSTAKAIGQVNSSCWREQVPRCLPLLSKANSVDQLTLYSMLWFLYCIDNDVCLHCPNVYSLFSIHLRTIDHLSSRCELDPPAQFQMFFVLKSWITSTSPEMSCTGRSGWVMDHLLRNKKRWRPKWSLFFQRNTVYLNVVILLR